MNNIIQATRDYERWLGRHMPLVPAHLRLKHDHMREGIFPFFRATFYRWAQIWPTLCPELAKAPKALAVGDLHVENFGTWRDVEGRLVWGINDFDEAATQPYTGDLVRLVASALLAGTQELLSLNQLAVADAILEGYHDGWRAGGRPFLLGEKNKRLLQMAQGELRSPIVFWRKIDSLKRLKQAPRQVHRAIRPLLPQPDLPMTFAARVCGLGSLGRPRYVALAEWRGARVVREAKAMAPSAMVWAGHANEGRGVLYQQILDRAVRCSDPFVRVEGAWLVRRLSPDCSRIELADLPARRDELRLLYCIGWETANIHCGTPKARKRVEADLAKRRPSWLLKGSPRDGPSSNQRLEGLEAWDGSIDASHFLNCSPIDISLSEPSF